MTRMHGGGERRGAGGFLAVALLLSLLLRGQPVQAQVPVPAPVDPATASASASVDSPAGLLSFDVHGFGSQGFMLTTGNDYLVADSKRGSFQVSEAGLNLSKDLTSKLRFGIQFFAQNFGASGDYVPRVDWFGLDYRWRDLLGLRAGRLKIPFGLFNEVNDIDSARVPILLPQSVYPLQSRSFLFAQSGGEIYGFLRSNWAGALEYRLYGGTSFIDPKLVVPVGSPIQLQFNVPYIYGGRLQWETPLRGLRFSGSFLKLRLDADAFSATGKLADIENHSEAWLVSVEYEYRAFALTAEYGRGHTKQDTVFPEMGVEVLDETSEAGYVMANVAIAAWLQSAVYWALQYPNVENRDGLSNKQHDVALTLRFDINAHWVFKLEGHYMAGTTGLINPLRIGAGATDPARRWAVFLAKTTAYF